MESDDLGFLTAFFLLWSYKIATLIVGYLFARLGFTLLIKGITGEFRFQAELKGAKADLVGASPGVFFILMGAAIIVVGLYRGLEINWPDSYLPSAKDVVTERPLLRKSPTSRSVDNGSESKSTP